MKKKVALYIAGVGTGGIESCSISQFCFMDKDRVDAEFLVDTPPSDNFNVQKIKNAGGKIISCFPDAQPSKSRKLKRPFAFIKTVRDNDYNVVHLHISNPTALLYALLCKWFTKAKVVATSHAQGVANRSEHFVSLCRFCAKHLSRFCDVRLGDSLLACKWMFADCEAAVMVNGIDTNSLKLNIAERAEVRSKLGVLDNETLVGHVGRFATDKNHKFIVEVFERYYKKHPNAKLLLVGKGELKESIKELCDAKGITERVIFIESAPSLSVYYWAMDLFLFPSLREGFGLVAVEAQSASLPVLASSAVPRETTQSNIIDYADLSADISVWVEKIDNLLLSNSERQTVDLTKVRQNCDIKNISNELIQIYNNL